MELFQARTTDMGDNGDFLVIDANVLRFAGGLSIMPPIPPMNSRRLKKCTRVAIGRLLVSLSVFGLLLAQGCMTTVQTERESGDPSLRSRRVQGPSGEIFEVVARCIREEYPDGQVFSEPAVGQISVTDYSMMRGDAVLQVSVTGRPDGVVDVSASATGLGADRLKIEVERFLLDFDTAYNSWARERIPSHPGGE